MATARVKVAPPEDTPLKQLAADLLRVRTELKPSLDIISNSELSEEDKMIAMRLFEAALEDPWDPMRNPRAAVAAVAAKSKG